MHPRMLLFVEGMDNVGKDTQIKRVVNHFSNEMIHTLHYHAVKSRNHEHARRMAELTYTEMFNILNHSPRTNFILNRSHYGEYVYGKMYRDYTDPHYVFDLEIRTYSRRTMMLHEAALIVFVTSDYQTLAAREDGGSLSQGQIDRIAEEHTRFISVHNRSFIPDQRKILINTAGKSIEEVWAGVRTFIDEVYKGTV